MNIKSATANFISTTYYHVYIDLKQFFRQKVEFISSLLTSISMVFAFGLGTRELDFFTFGADSYFTFIAPGIFAIGIMFSSTFTMGFTIILDKQRRSIEDIVTSPVSYSSFLAGRFLSMTIKSYLQMAILLFCAIVFFKLTISNSFYLIYSILLTSLFFTALGFVIGIYCTEVSFSGVSNFILLPLFFFSGVFFPIDGFGTMAKYLQFLPMAVHVSYFRYSVLGTQFENLYVYNILMVAYAAIMIFIASICFKKKMNIK
jgi:ABC-2 type transport system permease protein